MAPLDAKDQEVHQDPKDRVELKVTLVLLAQPAPVDLKGNVANLVHLVRLVLQDPQVLMEEKDRLVSLERVASLVNRDLLVTQDLLDREAQLALKASQEKLEKKVL